MSNLFEKIGSVVVSVGLAIGGFFGYAPEQNYVEVPVEEESLGADTVLPIAGMTFYLSGTGISSSATSFTLTSLTVTQNGKKITDAELSDIFYITLEPGSRTRQEIISCTTVVQNADGTATISGCTRGLAPITPYTASTTLQFAHAGGSIAIFSNPPQLYNQVAVKDNDETITGSWLFPTPVAGTNPATKDYVLGIVTGGTVSYDAIAVVGLAGETVATGTIIYLNRTDSRWYKADNDVQSTYSDQTLGIAQGDGTAGNNIVGGILTYGLDTTQVAMSGGNYIFLSGTAGATSTATTSQVLGKAISATTMFFDPNLIDSSVYVPTTFTATTTFTGPVFGISSSTIRVYETTSTWTKPTGLRYIEVWVCAGGGGGDSDAGGSGGAGAGGCAFEILTADDLSATTSVLATVGAAGARQASPTAGGNSSFGNFLSATGGSAGANQLYGSAGGTASGGDLNLSGQKGGTAGGTDTGSSGTDDACAGNGGQSAFGYYGDGSAGGDSSNCTSASLPNAVGGIITVQEYF